MLASWSAEPVKSSTASRAAASTVVVTTTVILVAVTGFFYINPSNWQPLLVPNTGEWGTYGWSGVLRGAGLSASDVRPAPPAPAEIKMGRPQRARRPARQLPFLAHVGLGSPAGCA